MPEAAQGYDVWCQMGARRRFETRRDGLPCPHKGCKSHVTHPCEVCGRKWGASDKCSASTTETVDNER